ncbi:hypothetical protein [Nannocystis pusilla]|uniref:hypothetical protein n=1 Tax=Nannocystis pusilla TaxID=889268 RepID=UPI003DA6953E
MAPLVWLWGAACLPDGATTATEGAATGDPGATGGDSKSTTSDSGATTGGPTSNSGDTSGDLSVTTGDSDSSGTCEETAGEPVCSAIPVTPGGDRGCGGEELTISGCDQLAGYELCPNLAVHRHTAGIPCDDSRLCDPRFSCHTDEECGPDKACVCNVTRSDDPPYSRPFYRTTSCVWAECRTDADCAFGMRCGVDTQCNHVIGLFCHTPEDGCEGDADCPERCGYSQTDKRWFCVGHVFCE